MKDFDHKACEFFAKYCHKQGISPRAVRESRRDGVRRPDFVLQIDGNTVVVEVKAIEKSREDCCDGSGVDVMEEDISRIRRKLGKANGQLRPYANRKIPGIVVIMDYTGEGLFCYKSDIHCAMFGKDTLKLSIPRDPLCARRIHVVGHKSGGSETLTCRDNTSISAVLLFSMVNEAHLFHNHFARYPISTDCAEKFVDCQYKSRNREGSIGNPWIRVR